MSSIFVTQISQHGSLIIVQLRWRSSDNGLLMERESHCWRTWSHTLSPSVQQSLCAYVTQNHLQHKDLRDYTFHLTGRCFFFSLQRIKLDLIHSEARPGSEETQEFLSTHLHRCWWCGGDTWRTWSRFLCGCGPDPAHLWSFPSWWISQQP